MATFVETDDVRILIDAGVSLAPSRYGLPPHEIELRRERELWEEIKKHAQLADVLIVTHYHYDHHDPNEPEIYKDKTVYIKHPKENINKSQEGRAAFFLRKLEGLPKVLEIADGREFRHGSTVVKFSPPVFHGTSPRLGYVVEVSISCGGEKLVHTSDVEGPSVEAQAKFPLEERPDILIVDGPMTYMLGYRYSKKSLELSIENLKRIVEVVPTVILEHHLLRDLRYRELLSEVYEHAEGVGARVMTAAEFLKRDVEMLEARRKELYGKE